jgi:hypothetical protein
MNNAKAVTINNTIFFEQKAYEDTSKILQMNAQSKLLDYIYYMNVMKLEKTELLIGLNNALININAGGGKSRDLEEYFSANPSNTNPSPGR